MRLTRTSEPAIVVPEDRSPSYLNRHIVTGAKFGLIGALALGAILAVPAATAVAPILGQTGFLVTSAGALGLLVGAGSGIGSIKGRQAVERNVQEGHAIHPPSRINEGLGQGVMNGLIVGLAAFTGTALFISTLPWALGLAAGIGVGATALLGYAQGKSRQETMATEYETAKAKASQMQHGMLDKLLDQFKSQEKAPEQATTIPKVTKEESAELDAKMRGGVEPRTDWVERMKKMAQDPERVV